ncbi:HET-domain-containing protein [Ophiobolus disseminans]|uniref:HET-domain-containing protein n=1 Tax=Ophiobolus disseminans TaxID=1469910 RepID=A0A6A7A8V5_9PLEO|nr:HET-domain-containing protein [Ophiobolus disseminans]
MLFDSKLCDVCNNTLRLIFGSIDDLSSQEIPHHLTKESLVDSVLHRSCHLCRLIIYHLKVRWAPEHRGGLSDLKEEPTSLTEEDFEQSDFDFATFSSDRVIVHSYMLELPEALGLHARIMKYGDGTDGVDGILEFDCDGFDNDIPRFWIFDQRAFGATPVMRRHSDNTAAAGSQAVVKSWLSQCEGHDDCAPRQQSFFPTRLLDIGDVDTTGQVRLVISKDLDETVRYVTLSHCWGDNVPFQLREETQEYMLEGFKVLDMPKTFRDAIAVARWADVRYIWIDSCCIIQGSKSDWEHEAKSMQQVYKHTYFNISADHSENSHGGCFVDRLAYKITPCPYSASDSGRIYFVPRFGLTRPLIESPIANRAWVSQERFLSPRILHFTAEQLFWECAGLYACETFALGMPHVYDNTTSMHYRASLDRALVHQQDSSGQLHKIWGRICQDYSRAKLTYTSDKLVAFAGIVQEFRLRLSNDAYLAGLWKTDFTNGLLWKVMALDGWPIQPNGSHELHADPCITASVQEPYRAPSWSWLGKNCTIFWQTRVRDSPQDMMSVLEVSVDLDNDDEPSGDIRGGHIKVKGYLRPAQWKQDRRIDLIILDGKSGDQLLASSEKLPPSKSSYFTVQRDVGTEFPVKDIFCFPVRMSIPPGGPSQGFRMIEGLILGPTEEANKYQRLGHFEAVGKGHCRALIYELQPLAHALSQPWKSLAPQLEVVANKTEVDVGGDDSQYDDEYFREVKESVFTII